MMISVSSFSCNLWANNYDIVVVPWIRDIKLPIPSNY